MVTDVEKINKIDS